MDEKPECLLHICCAPDATSVVERLKETYQVKGFFHNPNIHPESEYQKRLIEAQRVGRIMGFELRVPKYSPDDWLRHIRGLEDEPEKGARCLACHAYNLNATAQEAKASGIPFFTTTLTVSPHKLTEKIMASGTAAGQTFGVDYLPIDFKKKDGFKQSLQMSKAFNLYRQNYCGCKYSLRILDYA